MANNIIIVGKPNVGKSSLFNALVKKNLALVDNSPRYTRDIKKKNFVLFDQEVTLIDSPGLFEPKDEIEEKIIQYTKDQISRSDLILLVFNAKEELSNDDHRLVSLIRKCEKKKIIILNKTEGKFNSNIVNDIQKLWDAGIETWGSCCGHATALSPTVIVGTVEQEQQAKELLGDRFVVWSIEHPKTLSEFTNELTQAAEAHNERMREEGRQEIAASIQSIYDGELNNSFSFRERDAVIKSVIEPHQKAGE